MKVLPRFLYLFAFLGMAVGRGAGPRPGARSLHVDHPAARGHHGRRCWARPAWCTARLGASPSCCCPSGRTCSSAPFCRRRRASTEPARLYHFYVNAFATGAEQYASKFFPLSLTGRRELRLLAGHRRLLPHRRGLVLGPQPAAAYPRRGARPCCYWASASRSTMFPRALAPALVFLVLAACVLVLSRSLERRTWRLRDAIPGVLVGAAGAALAVLLLGAAPSAAAAPWQDWRSLEPLQPGQLRLLVQLAAELPPAARPARPTPSSCSVESSKPAYWRANALDEFTGDSLDLVAELPSRQSTSTLDTGQLRLPHPGRRSRAIRD